MIDARSEIHVQWQLMVALKRIAVLETLLKRAHGTFFGRHAKGVCEICDFLREAP